MNTLSELFTAPTTAPTKNADGSYRLIKITPDPVTGEAFNVGIVIEQGRGRKVKTIVRLLDDVSAFGCLYPPTAVENLSHVLAMARQASERGQLSSLRGLLDLSAPSHINGSDLEREADGLFDTLVTLGRAKPAESPLNETSEGVGNNDLRRHVLGYVKHHAEGLYKKAFHTSPVSITAGQETRPLDLSVYHHPGMDTGELRYAAIASAFIKTDVTRGFHLDRAAINLINARDLLQRSGASRGAFFILRPHEGARGFTESDLRDIDNDIDNAMYPFMRDKCFTVDTFTRAEDLAKAAMAHAVN